MVARGGAVGVGEEMQKKNPKLLPFFMNSLKDLQHQIVFKTRKRNRGKHAYGPIIKHILGCAKHVSGRTETAKSFY